MKVSALQRLLLTEFDQKTSNLGRNLCPLYRECPLYGVSVLERFHCIVMSIFCEYLNQNFKFVVFMSLRAVSPCTSQNSFEYIYRYFRVKTTVILYLDIGICIFSIHVKIALAGIITMNVNVQICECLICILRFELHI